MICRTGLKSVPRGSTFHVTQDMESPMESEEKNSYLFYLIVALIVLGFIASLAFPINAQENKLRDVSRFARDFVPAT